MIIKIDGAIFRTMLNNASVCIESNQKSLNELNVFPVPDGDTGTNMTMTITAAAREVVPISETRIGKTAEKTASMLLRSARGNSGVILSLLFRGFSKGLKDTDSANARQIAIALKEGVAAAYGAVMRPAEGTILTVSRVAAEEAERAASETDDVVALFDRSLQAAKDALLETTHQNPVLEKAGVVDAGGQGWVYVLEGFCAALHGESLQSAGTVQASESSAFEQFETEDIHFAYCTEFIVQRDDTKKDPLRLRAFLESIGDCVVVVDDEEIIKVHVHTNHPGDAMEEGLKYGSLTSLKVENMKEQHTQKLQMLVGEPIEAEKEEDIVPAEKEYGFVVVAAGSGVAELFRDFGVDFIVEGGQTMNPSTEDILRAVNKTPAETVFVLPNNKNIILAAEQVQPLTERKVIVLPTRTIPQGVSAMLAYDMGADVDTNVSAMKEAADRVRTGLITYAARNSNFDGIEIQQGDFLALAEGKMCYTGHDLSKALKKTLDSIDGKEAEFVTLYKGHDATEEQNELVESILPKLAPSAEINTLDGDQPVYYYMISAE